MSIYQIEYSPVALEDLRDINNYLINNWGESLAKKTLGKITSDIRRLEQLFGASSEIDEL